MIREILREAARRHQSRLKIRLEDFGFVALLLVVVTTLTYLMLGISSERWVLVLLTLILATRWAILSFSKFAVDEAEKYGLPDYGEEQ